MKRIIIFIYIFTILSSVYSQVQSRDDFLVKMVESIDSIHDFKGFLINTEIITKKGSRETGKMTGKCLFKNIDESIFLIKYPQKDNGKAVLQRQASFYMYFPNIRKSQPVMSNSRLFGDFNSSDVLKPPFKENYEAKYLRFENNLHVIEFTALNNALPYQKQILYYNEKKEEIVSTEYYSRSGKLLKKAYYDTFTMIGDKKVYSQVRIESVLGVTSIMKMSNYKKMKFNNNYFTPNGLRIVAETF